jgi:IS1 family transposase
MTMNKLSIDDRAKIIGWLIEGCSMRSITRLTGAAKKTVERLLVAAGTACADYQDKVMRDLPCLKVQCDENWAFCYAKDADLPEDKQGKPGFGSIWTWTAICADTKLIPCWYIGERDAGAAYEFIQDLKNRLKHRVQLTTDGHKAYLLAVEDAFGAQVNYAILVKMYGRPTGVEHHYSPPVYTGCTTITVQGKPVPSEISTSYVERANLTMRMGMRRFTRLTNGFSKKYENHCQAVALHFMHYNFCRIHQSLRCTPAMEAQITDHVWNSEEIAALIG